jgi:hypothetical protein
MGNFIIYAAKITSDAVKNTPMSHDDCLRDWSDINDITLSSSGAVLLVVLMWGFPKYAAEIVSGSMISMPCLMTIAWGIEVILRILPYQVQGLYY